jgi:hypothetical protein
VAILDFRGVGLLNRLLGYEAVNSMFKNMFATFMWTAYPILIGRWFSGDEIAIITTGELDQVVKALMTHASVVGLEFRAICFYNQTNLSELKVNQIPEDIV